MLGVMQGRLSKPLSKKIQEFPLTTWRAEFRLANELGLKAIEWTVDLYEFKRNPLFDIEARKEIAELQLEFDISVPSVTLDCFVEAPLHGPNIQSGLSSEISDLRWIAEHLKDSEVRILVLPVVSEGAIFDDTALKTLILKLNSLQNAIGDLGMRIALECEFGLASISKVLNELDPSIFGVNFDMGNSAALGHDPEDELKLCSGRIFNVHIKDRIRGGSTVPLGNGAVNFPKVSAILKGQEYGGNMILQAARSETVDEKSQVSSYIDFCKNLGWVNGK